MFDDHAEVRIPYRRPQLRRHVHEDVRVAALTDQDRRKHGPLTVGFGGALNQDAFADSCALNARKV